MGKYCNKDICNACGLGENKLSEFVTDCGYISECTTKCGSCGFLDRWCYGFYESWQFMVGWSKNRGDTDA